MSRLEGIGLKFPLIAGAVLCFTAVAFGAFGAHALDSLLMSHGRQGVYELANRYHFYHGLGLIAIACIRLPIANLDRWVVIPLLVGTLIFSGSLYLLAVTNISWFGAITPIGGVLLLIGWASLVMKVRRTQS